jgi:hypothetical protein
MPGICGRAALCHNIKESARQQGRGYGSAPAVWWRELRSDAAESSFWLYAGFAPRHARERAFKLFFRPNCKHMEREKIEFAHTGKKLLMKVFLIPPKN